ncbi:Flp pilus assembly protein TadG [Paenibacillus phyllosphaerae]|uniref:Flp pilus assembly protein TadG n=1 Tax=Paenibacillus phyllosphaerae TaxID=274593 RepID=A0A7W5B3M8_9BACL|nr:TadE family protein [Paenibacillus phyllosphaerae]MBB3113823.1 Flp pilus assembly protein TadG [Paenibacillus phyllosphaerae]
MIKDQRGQSIVEFALLLPLLLLLLCGIVDLGRLLFAYSSLQMTVQETVRLGGLGRSDAEMTTYAKGHLRVGDPSGMTVTISPAQSVRKSGQNLTVTVHYSLPLITPVMTAIIPAPVLSANSTIRVE